MDEHAVVMRQIDALIGRLSHVVEVYCRVQEAKKTLEGLRLQVKRAEESLLALKGEDRASRQKIRELLANAMGHLGGEGDLNDQGQRRLDQAAV